MKQYEKVTVKLTLDMDVESALTAFDDCKTIKDVVDCMVLGLNDQFNSTGSGFTITHADVVKKLKRPHGEKDIYICKADFKAIDDYLEDIPVKKAHCGN